MEELNCGGFRRTWEKFAETGCPSRIYLDGERIDFGFVGKHNCATLPFGFLLEYLLVSEAGIRAQQRVGHHELRGALGPRFLSLDEVGDIRGVLVVAALLGVALSDGVGDGFLEVDFPGSDEVDILYALLLVVEDVLLLQVEHFHLLENPSYGSVGEVLEEREFLQKIYLFLQDRVLVRARNFIESLL